MKNILKQISTLYEQKLYSNLILLAELVVSQSEQRTDFTPYIKFQLYVFYADSLFHIHQYSRAENAYSQALQIRKFITKTKNSPKIVDAAPTDMMTDVDIKYQMYLCYTKMKQTKRAIEILQDISLKSRTPRINMALGNMFRDAGIKRRAVVCYKEVLRECPLAIQAAENLLKLGVEGTEVNSLMLEATCELGWVNNWLRGQAQMTEKDYHAAITTFKSIDSLSDNSTVLVNIAFCYNYLCDDKNALKYLRQAFRSDPNFKTGRGLLACLLANSGDKSNIRELEKMIGGEVDTTMWNSEQWVVMGYYMFATKKYERAAYFGQQACMMNRKNIEALLLKASTFMQINSYNESILHFREILEYAPNRYDAHKGLVECYIALNKQREALTTAATACKQLNNTAQALTLYASVLMKDVVSISKVRGVLDRALAANPLYTPAVCLLAEYLDSEQSHEEACFLLQAHVDKIPSSKTHQLLADCLTRLQREDDAFTHYNAALRLDPQNQRAMEGLNNLGRTPSKIDSSYYISVVRQSTPYTAQGANVSSDHDFDPESDSEWPSSSDFMPI